jgi:peptide/nickel transport system substrate-binding protein
MWVALAAATLGAAAPAMAESVVTVVREIDTDRYDPQKSTSRSGADAKCILGDKLVSYDFDMKTLKPGLATSWTSVARRPYLHLQAAR